VGNAGNITAYWKGYRESYERKRSRSLPHMMGFQAEGAAPIVRGSVVENPQTIASAIRIGNPANWNTATTARDESNGLIDAVSDQEILEAHRWLARQEGLFVEAASAAGVAGLLKLSRQSRLDSGSTVVCTLTGHGLKDPGLVIDHMPQPTVIPPRTDAVLAAIEAHARSLKSGSFEP